MHYNRFKVSSTHFTHPKCLSNLNIFSETHQIFLILESLYFCEGCSNIWLGLKLFYLKFSRPPNCLTKLGHYLLENKSNFCALQKMFELLPRAIIYTLMVSSTSRKTFVEKRSIFDLRTCQFSCDNKSIFNCSLANLDNVCTLTRHLKKAKKINNNNNASISDDNSKVQGS